MLNFIRQKQNAFGGAENYLLRLSQTLKQQNIDFKLIYSTVPQWLPSWIKALWFNTELCLNKLRHKQDIYFSLERITCADIYRAGDGVHKVFLENKKQQNNKISFNPLNPVYLWLEKKCFNQSKHIIANSHLIKKQIIESYKIPEEKISVVHNGIQIKEYDTESIKLKFDQEFKLEQETKVLLYVGSGFNRKGVKEFLTIISKLKNENFVAFVVGKEKKLSFYTELAKTLGIADRVFFTGARTDIDDFYVVSDIFLFPTHYEPFSNVVLEAASFKNAIFTTKQNGASEILSDEFIMSKPDDYSVVKKIEALLNNSDALNQVKSDNLVIVKKMPLEKNVEETLAVIKKITA